jgi:hypothetical protein
MMRCNTRQLCGIVKAGNWRAVPYTCTQHPVQHSPGHSTASVVHRPATGVELTTLGCSLLVWQWPSGYVRSAKSTPL